MAKKKDNTKDFEEFVNQRTGAGANDSSKYEYSDSATIKNRFRYLFSSSKLRLKKTCEKLLQTKKGTCWELAISYDYHLLKRGIRNHHIVAVKTGSLTCHTFNLYVDSNKKLHIVDLYERLNDTTIGSYDDFQSILRRMYDSDYKKWYVLSEVKNNFSENFKRLGMKKWASFCSDDPADGGFVIINNLEKTFEINERKNIKWRFNPFKFPAFG